MITKKRHYGCGCGKRGTIDGSLDTPEGWYLVEIRLNGVGVYRCIACDIDKGLLKPEWVVGREKMAWNNYLQESEANRRWWLKHDRKKAREVYKALELRKKEELWDEVVIWELVRERYVDQDKMFWRLYYALKMAMYHPEVKALIRLKRATMKLQRLIREKRSRKKNV